jgi:hypothetical protein
MPGPDRTGPDASTSAWQVATSTARTVVESILSSGERATVIEECRRCGMTIESSMSGCSACGCEETVEYRIR